MQAFPTTCPNSPTPDAAKPPERAPTAASLMPSSREYSSPFMAATVAFIATLTTAPITAPITICQNLPFSSTVLTGLFAQ